MKTAAVFIGNDLLVLSSALIVLGVLFWTGHAMSSISLHMALGVVLVLSLWALAVLAAVARVSLGLVILSVAWGFVVPILGVVQTRLLPGPAHWVIQVLHLLVGMAALGLADTLATRITSVAGALRSPGRPSAVATPAGVEGGVARR